MKTTCPHCSVHIDIDSETHAALQGQTHFQCPWCNDSVAVPPMSAASPVVTAPANTLVRAHRGLNRNLLILGSAALLVLGGIGFFLASRKSGDTHNTHQNIRNEIINNSYFQNLIASGSTTMKEIEAIGEIRPYQDGFIGISNKPLAWNAARELATKTGAIILPIGNPVEDRDEILITWIRENFASHLVAPVWVSSIDKPYLCGASQPMPSTDLATRHRVMLAWNLQKTTTQPGHTVESPPVPSSGNSLLAADPEFSYTVVGAAVTITGCKGPTPLITIPSSISGMPVTTIGNNAFLYNPVIRRLTIPETVDHIESYAFFGCEKLASVQIPESVLRIGSRAFGGCKELIALDVAMANPSFKVVDGILYSKDGITLWQYPGGKGGKFTIPDGVSKVGGWAFANSRLVEEIHIPAAITEIGAEAFGSCDSLRRIEVSPENPLFSSRDGVLLNKDTTVILQYPGGRTGACEIPSGVVGFDAVFAYAGKLTRVTIPASVTRVGNNAFFACANLSRVDFAGDAPQSFGNNVFEGCSAGFRVFFQPGMKGFTTPTWKGYPCAQSPDSLLPNFPSAPAGSFPWTDSNGKTIQAEFIRFDGDAVVIRKDGKQFTLPLTKLSPESRKQAVILAGQTNPAPE